MRSIRIKDNFKAGTVEDIGALLPIVETNDKREAA
jgi:hypothetical protein